MGARTGASRSGLPWAHRAEDRTTALVCEQKESLAGPPGRLAYAATGSAPGAGVASGWAGGRAGLVTSAVAGLGGTRRQ